MRVLVTGAYGRVGRAVVRRLAHAGHDAVAMTHRPPDAGLPEAPVAATVRADLRDPAGLRDAVRGVDAVCHLAALTDVRESFDRPGDYTAVNHRGTVALLDACAAEFARHGTPIRFVQASTAAVYCAPDHDRPQGLDEGAPTAPTSPYGTSKLAADQAVFDRSRGGAVAAVVLRAFNAAGDAPERDDPRIIPRALAVAAGHAPHLDVHGDGSALRDFVHTDDLARAYLLALDACAPGGHRTYNVGATPARVTDVVTAAERVTARPVPVVHHPAKPEPRCLIADTTRIRQDLGWSPECSDLDELIADTWCNLSPGSGVTSS